MSDESLLRQLRKLKEENRSLKKLVKKLSRGNKRVSILEELVKDYNVPEEDEQVDSKKCPKCLHGTRITTQLGDIRTIVACDTCNNREVVKHARKKQQT